MIFKLKKIMEDGSHMQSMKVEDSDEHVCLNCGTKFRGNFCPCCRQNADTHRLNMRDTLRNFFARFVKVDSGFLHTVFHLLYRPGYMVRDYIRGYRTEYLDPLMLLIILIAIEYLLPDIEGDFVSRSLPENYVTMLTPHPVSMAVMKFWTWIINDYQRFMIFLSFASALTIVVVQKILRLKKDTLNLSESFHMMLYVICYTEIVDIISTAITVFVPNFIQVAMIISGIVFLLVASVVVHRNIPMSWWKFLLFMVLFPIGFIAAFLSADGIVALILKIDLPKDIYQQIDILGMME